MKKKLYLMLAALVMMMFMASIVFAGEETVFSGNLRLHYSKMKDSEDFFGIHFFELRAKKQVGPMGIFVNERIGDGNANYLYEGWISYKAPGSIGAFKLGLVPVPFGIFANGLYYPKGIPYSKNWMWEYDYGVRYDGVFKASEALGVNASVAYLSRENSAGELGAFEVAHPDCSKCTGERDTVSGRLGVDLKAGDALSLKVGGSMQMGSLEAVEGELVKGKLVPKLVDGQTVPVDDQDRLGIAGDITLSPKLPIPVTLMGEFINYSLGEIDDLKGNIIMGQLDVTPVQKMGNLDKATLSLHVSMDMPTEGKQVTALVGQLRLIMCKQFNIFAQVFGNMVEDADEMTGQGVRIWFMYAF